MFANFKGMDKALVPTEVERMIQAVGLTEKRHEYSKNLSGGQKRKLSVAIAFIGDSRVVILGKNFCFFSPFFLALKSTIHRSFTDEICSLCTI